MEAVEFVRVKARYRNGRIDPASYQDEVAERARLGWRLVQILVENPAAVVDEYVLVLAKAA